MADTFDVIVIGAGPGGYIAAIRAAQLGLKTACIEKTPELGGTCLNVGCIPSKALLYSSELYATLLHTGKTHGIEASDIKINFTQMMDRKQNLIKEFNAGIHGLFKKNKITLYTGDAKFTSQNTISIQSKTTSLSIEGKYIILATGSEPIPLPHLPFDHEKILSSTDALSLTNIPKSLLVVGAGIIGVELGSVYSRLGTQVTFVEFLDRICPTLDPTISKELQTYLIKQGMTFHLNAKMTNAKAIDSQMVSTIQMNNQSTQEIRSDKILVAIGRSPLTSKIGLDLIGIAVTPKGFIPINGEFRTTIPHIFAIGDIVDGPMLAHKASEEGCAVAEIIAGHKPTIQYIAIPNVVYTSPEVATVGMTEQEAKDFGLTPITGTFPFKANSRAKCTGQDEGFVKIIADAKTDALLGVHIIGQHASELIAEASIAIAKHVKVLDIAHTPHAHPTLSEALKEAALAVHKRALHK